MKIRSIIKFFTLSACLFAGSHLFAMQGDNSMQGQGGSMQNQGSLQWYTDFNQAVQTAQQQNKPLLLFFSGSDWCGWCKKLESEVFNKPEFASAVGDKFIFVDIDFPMNKQLPAAVTQQNEHLKNQYHVTGYPTVVILDPNLNVLETTGYQQGGAQAYANYLMQFARR